MSAKVVTRRVQQCAVKRFRRSAPSNVMNEGDSNEEDGDEEQDDSDSSDDEYGCDEEVSGVHARPSGINDQLDEGDLDFINEANSVDVSGQREKGQMVSEAQEPQPKAPKQNAFRKVFYDSHEGSAGRPPKKARTAPGTSLHDQKASGSILLNLARSLAY